MRKVLAYMLAFTVILGLLYGAVLMKPRRGLPNYDPRAMAERYMADHPSEAVMRLKEDVDKMMLSPGPDITTPEGRWLYQQKQRTWAAKECAHLRDDGDYANYEACLRVKEWLK